MLSVCLALRAAPIKVVHRTTIFQHTGSDPKDPANATGFNHAPSITRLPDGRLLVVWFSGPFEGSSRQRIANAWSSDKGRTWSAAGTIQDFEGKADFDPALIVSDRQTLFFFSAGLKHVYPFETGQSGPVGDDAFRIYLRGSSDSGRSWSSAREIYAEPAHTSRTNGIRLSSAELLLPIHKLGTKAGGVLKSSDNGKTWTRFGNVANPAGQGGEPTIAELKSGRVMMLLRTTDGQLWRSYSSDKGETWSVPETTGLTAGATSHNLFRTRAGTLVLTHNPSKPPLRNPLTMRISKDDGATWSEPTTIAALDFPVTDSSWQVAYPSVAQVDDRTLVVVWTRIRVTSDEKYGDIQVAQVTIQ
jgi:sialidase-1